MIVTNKINAYIHQNGEYRIDTVQGDSARVLELTLYAGAAEWSVPEGASVQVRFRKPDGTGGYYDTLPDGTCAYRVQGNSVTVALAPQVLTVAGVVEAQVLLCWNEGELATFTVRIQVQADPSLGTLESEDYVNLSDWVANRVKNYLQEAQEELRELYAIPGAFFVHMYQSGGSYVANKTYEEIVAVGPRYVTSEPDGGRPVFCVLWWPSGREYVVLSLASHDAYSQRFEFSRIEGNIEHWAVITASSGVNAGRTHLAMKDELPKELPNPGALTLNGQVYDGSEAVEVEIKGADPLYVTGSVNGAASCSLAEMYAAHQAGCPVYFNWQERLLPTVRASEGAWCFTGMEANIVMLVMLETDTEGNTVVTVQRSWELLRTEHMPTALPNPNPLTINGQSYDGSKAVEITVSGETDTSAGYRLIERRELSVDTETTLTFSDLNLSAFQAYLSVPKGTATASVGAAAYIGSTMVGYSWLASMISDASSRVAMVEGRVEGSLVVYGNTTPVNTTSNTQIFSRSPVRVEASGLFTKLEFGAGSGVAFPAGSVIEIWGIDG